MPSFVLIKWIFGIISYVVIEKLKIYSNFTLSNILFKYKKLSLGFSI